MIRSAVPVRLPIFIEIRQRVLEKPGGHIFKAYISKFNNSAKNHQTGTGLLYAQLGMVLINPTKRENARTKFSMLNSSKKHQSGTGLRYAQLCMVLITPTKFHRKGFKETKRTR